MAMTPPLRERLERACKEDLKELNARIKFYRKLRARAGDLEDKEDIDFVTRMLSENIAKYEKLINS